MASSNNGAYPFHTGPVFYVPPLRIVAPPGVAPYLPAPFDPYNFVNGARPDFPAPNADGNGGSAPAFPASRADTGSVNQNPNVSSNGDGTKVNPAAKVSVPDSSARNGASINPNVSAGNGHETSKIAGEGKTVAPKDVRKKLPAEDINGNDTQGSVEKKRGRELKPRKPAPTPSPSRSVSHDKSSHKSVLQTLRIYDALRRNLMLDEENKGKDASKGSRPDLNAGSIINSRSLAVNRDSKIVGSVPGIEVGDLFYFRMEMCCVGMHGPIQGGIEYLTVRESEYKTPVAISVISSGGYDAKDDGEELIYAGQGGKSREDSKPIEDQKLERGNLALEGSMKHNVPVRVTRGIKDNASPSGKTYTYDGLYKVEECWSEKAKHGFEEFRFRLRRLPGQPELGSTVLKLSNSLKYKPHKREGLCLADLAGGKEGTHVCVVNSIDDIRAPAPFEYSTILQYPHGSVNQKFGPTEGCGCSGICDMSQSCSCFKKNGNTCGYLHSGILVKERNVIYECGSNCKCSVSCRNRLTQKGLKYRLEVFKTEDKGWGLRSWDTIPAGSFICEYTGKLVLSSQSLHNRDYILDLSRFSGKEPWGDVSKLLDIKESQSNSNVRRPDFIIDSSQCGNASRFINHSCSPNVLVQCVLRDHQDAKLPHIMLFAMDNIPPFRELTIDFGGPSSNSDTQSRSRKCLCHSKYCRGTFCM